MYDTETWEVTLVLKSRRGGTKCEDEVHIGLGDDVGDDAEGAEVAVVGKASGASLPSGMALAGPGTMISESRGTGNAAH